MIAIHSTKRQRGLIWFGAARAIIGRNDVPRGTMDEVSSYVRLDLLSARRQGRPKDCSTSSSNPMMEGPWCRFRREARARERHRHCGWDSLKALDPKRPIREADIRWRFLGFSVGPLG